MVGAALACVLGRHGYKIALIEAQEFKQAKQPGFDDRAIALSWGSSRILNQLGLWQPINAVAAPIKKIHVSDRGHFGLTQIFAEEEKVPALGYVVTARQVGEVLIHTLMEGDYCQLFYPARLLAIENEADRVNLTVEMEQQRVQLRAKLVIAADGAQSAVRSLLGISYTERDYQQDAIVANLTPQFDHNNTAFERFTGTGPIAVLPMRPFRQSPRCALIWTVPRAHARQLLDTDDAAFLAILQQQFGYRLGYLTAVGKRSSYPLSLIHINSRSPRRIVFIGNAAQTIHPVAGQGFNLALRDMAALLDCLLHPGPAIDPGASDLLQRYSAIRKTDQHRVIRFTDSLIKIFSNELPLFRHARAASLSVLDLLPPLRRKLVYMSMGLQTALPHIPDR